MSNTDKSNEEAILPATVADEEVIQISEDKVQSFEPEEEEEEEAHENKASSSTTNNGASSGKGVFYVTLVHVKLFKYK